MIGSANHLIAIFVLKKDMGMMKKGKRFRTTRIEIEGSIKKNTILMFEKKD